MIVICLSIISLTGGLFLLAHSRKENLGKFFATCAVLIMLGSLATLGAGICKMMCHGCHDEMDMQSMHAQMPGGSCQGMPMNGPMPECCKKGMPADSSKIDGQNEMGAHPAKGN